MAESLVLQTLRVDPKDVRVLRSLLNLAHDRTEESWTVESEGEGDFPVVDVDSPEGADLWERLASGPRPTVALSRRRDFKARYVLHKPLRMPELMQVLAELAVAATEDTEREAWRVMTLASEGEPMPLSEHLRRHSWSRAVSLRFDELPELILDPGSGVWYSTASERQLADILGRNFLAREAVPLTSTELVERARDLEQQNLANLRWRAGLAQSEGRLHPDLAGNVSFMLPQVPLQALSDTAYSRQARILLQGPMDCDELMASSQALAEDVAEFLNACHACGYLLISRTNGDTARNSAAA